jgi:hypothetical protein
MYIWLDESIIHDHVGIRRTIINLRNVLCGNDIKITFLLQERLMQQKGLVRKLTFSDYWLTNNGMNSMADNEIGSASLTPIFTLCQLSDLNETCHILSAPWLLQNFQEMPLIKKSSLIVFLPDLIPLRYSLEGLVEIDAWVYSHSLALEMATKNLLKLLVCSDEIATEVQNLLPNYDFSESIIVIHPGLYVEHLKVFGLDKAEGERQQILMLNILDRRKGMLKAQEYVGNLETKEEICIIGHSRCSADDLASFLKVLRNHKHKWLKSIGTEEIVREFNDSKLLLFPSQHEGYGIPAIEANFFGLPVLTFSNLPVWKDLAFKIDLDLENLAEINPTASFLRPGIEDIQKFRSDLNEGLNKWVRKHFISS